MNDQRANSFLNLIRKSQRGRLKIYLGYSAGVGKTYQMLLEARRLQSEGVNIAAGYVETHGRAETEALLQGLQIIPRRTFTYHSIEVTEMDLYQILEAKPEVVLVDELAHSNVPGSINAKRYQDVEDILAAGIHVISTLNIQHLESLFDTVETATGVKVRERVPDRILVEADQIVSVDVSVEDLVTRLKEGKIYVQEGVNNALSHFFRTDNLEQLRELTLRELASQIDFRRRESVEADTTTSVDQVMVCLSSKGANREKLLRFTSRLAGRLNRNWYAVYVQTPCEKPEKEKLMPNSIISESLKLAQQLGATVFTYKGEDIVDTIKQFAKEYRVGNIVIGTPGSGISFWDRLRGKKGISQRLIEEISGASIIVFDTRKQVEFPDLNSKHKKTINPSQTSEFDHKHPLRSAQVIIWDEFIDWNEAIRELINSISKVQPNLNEDYVWAKINEREQQGATYLKANIRFPHCRIEGIAHPLLVIGIAKAGVLNTYTGDDAKLIILLLSPVDDPNIHLQKIAQLAGFMKDEISVKQLIDSDSVEDAKKILEAWST